MATSPTPSTSVLPTGRWQLQRNGSEITFRARGMWGLAPVKGRFGDYEGELTVDEQGARGELRINAATLDTGNARRDKHLRSADFFEVEAHPLVTFTLTGLTPDSGGQAQATGTLRVRDNQMPLTLPVTIDTHDDHLHLNTEISVDRAAAGLGWSRMGMIQGPAHLHVHAVLVRED